MDISLVLKERDDLQVVLLGFEKQMEDIQTKVKALTSERDQLSAQYQQVWEGTSTSEQRSKDVMKLNF